MILKPPKLYLDTNHLVNISKVRNNKQLPSGQSVEAYKFIDKCIKSWCGLVFNQYSPLEWLEGAATLESAEKIAAVIDSAELKYLLESDQLIYTREILDECLRINPDLRIPEFPVLQSLHDRQTFQSSLGIILDQIPGYFDKEEAEKLGLSNPVPNEIPVNPASVWAKESLRWRQVNPEKCQERIDGFKDFMITDIDGKDEYFNNPDYYQREWMKRLLKIDRILAINPGIDIDDILKKTDFDNCPAVSLYRKVRENRMRSSRAPDKNDVDDYVYLPVIPYVDIALIERQLCGHIIQADNRLKSKVFYKAGDVAKILKG